MPHGAAIDNLTTITIEFCIQLGKAQAGQMEIIRKYSGAIGWKIYIADYGKSFYIYGWTTDGNRYCSGTPPFDRQGFYHIQMTWDRSNVTNKPVLKINNVNQTVSAWTVSGTSTTWTSDAAYNLIFDCLDVTGWTGTLFLVRVHNRILTADELITNYNYDRWRYSVVAPFAAIQDTVDIEGVGAQTLAAPPVNFTDTEDEDGVWGWNYTPPTNISETVGVDATVLMWHIRHLLLKGSKEATRLFKGAKDATRSLRGSKVAVRVLEGSKEAIKRLKGSKDETRRLKGEE
jgi:hypothetical protein